jgi:hypothetical protein
MNTNKGPAAVQITPHAAMINLPTPRKKPARPSIAIGIRSVGLTIACRRKIVHIHLPVMLYRFTHKSIILKTIRPYSARDSATYLSSYLLTYE